MRLFPPPPPPRLFNFGSFMVLWPFGSIEVFLQADVCVCVVSLLTSLYVTQMHPYSQDCTPPIPHTPTPLSPAHTHDGQACTESDSLASFSGLRDTAGSGLGAAQHDVKPSVETQMNRQKSVFFALRAVARRVKVGLN